MIRVVLTVIMLWPALGLGQCMASLNPVGGTDNLLNLPPNSMRLVTYYKHGAGDQYYEGSEKSDYSLIGSANYNFLGSVLGYGVTQRLMVEAELGYFVNKTQVYNTVPEYTTRGYGLSNAVLSARYAYYSNPLRRVYISSSLGLKIPLSTSYQKADGVQLPKDVQPTIGAFGLVIQTFFVKEDSYRSLRFFATNRIELNQPNIYSFRLGNSCITSLYVSKHLVNELLGGDWTAILQLRNEVRAKDLREDKVIDSSGGVILFIAPQINYSFGGSWNLSAMVDIPFYHYLHGTQLGSKYGVTLSLAKELNLN